MTEHRASYGKESADRDFDKVQSEMNTFAERLGHNDVLIFNFDFKKPVKIQHSAPSKKSLEQEEVSKLEQEQHSTPQKSGRV